MDRMLEEHLMGLAIAGIAIGSFAILLLSALLFFILQQRTYRYASNPLSKLESGDQQQTAVNQATQEPTRQSGRILSYYSRPGLPDHHPLFSSRT